MLGYTRNRRKVIGLNFPVRIQGAQMLVFVMTQALFIKLHLLLIFRSNTINIKFISLVIYL